MKKGFYIIQFLFTFFAVQQLAAQCATEPAVAPWNGANEPLGGSITSWGGTGFLSTDDASTANAGIAGLDSPGATYFSDYICISDMGFTLTATSVACGYGMRIDRYAILSGDPGVAIEDNLLVLRSGGNFIGTNHASPTPWNITEDIIAYGGASDDWGVTLTPAEINDPGFGGCLSVNYTVPTTENPFSLDAHVDFMSLTVFFAETLPVEWLSFELKTVNRVVQVKWATASETNNEYFTIECSVNGTGWEELKQIPGSGNSNSIQAYSWMHYTPYSGISYYRIKQTDYDGAFKYSEIRAITLEETDNVNIWFDMQQQTIQLVRGNLSPMKITVYNALGQLVKTSHAPATGTVVSIPAADLNTGIYTIVAETNFNRYATKLYVK